MHVGSLQAISDAVPLREIVLGELWRGHRGFYAAAPDETLCVNDLIVNNGRVHIAQRMTGDDTISSKMNYMSVGTVSTAAGLTDTTLTGEVKRKALAVYSATTNNVITAVATFGGAADSVSSLQMTEAGLFNHASSGQGTMMQRVTFAAVTLADSDLFKITLQTNVGSNTI